MVRSRGWRGTRATDDLATVRYRDLEALVRPVLYETPKLGKEELEAHQRMVEGAMRRDTILPAPYGIVFRSRRHVIRFLEDQYIVLDEALAFVDGHWELRLHMRAVEDFGPELHELAVHLYSELRRFARAAVPLNQGGLLDAAFLVDRTAWIEFVERADDMSGSHPELALDVTGPWPPYDFVKMNV
ncbi:MAG: GvpL/GvpF family gas vesicle protein [Gemmatimonadota bacterium]